MHVFTASTVTIVTAPAPLQPLLQPSNVDPIAAVGAVSVTTVPSSYGSLQSDPQSIPAGLDMMFPVLVPVPTCSAVRVNCCVNVAVQLRAALIVTLPPPSQSPLHPEKTDPTAGMAVRPTIVPWL